LAHSLTFCYTKAIALGDPDVLVDGFLAHTFSPQDAYALFTFLLRIPHFRSHVSYSEGVWYINYVQQPSSGLPTQLPLDFSVKTTEGTVVPQRRWTPTDEVDIRRQVQEAQLQLPVFFVHRNGGVGFLLPDILEDRDLDLYNRDSRAPLGGRTTTHIRINVSSLSYLTAKDFSYMFVDSFHSGLDMTIGDARYQYETRRIRGARSRLVDS